jgi:HlyD family secretion protein
MWASLRFWQCSCLGLLGILLVACQQQQQPAPQRDTQRMQGYIQGQYRYIAMDFPVVLREIYVQRGTHVTPGQPLFSLEIEGDVLKEAQSQLQQANQQLHHDEASAAMARLTIKHREKLLLQNAVSQEEVDDAVANYDAAEAQVAKDRGAATDAENALAQASGGKTQKIVMAEVPALVANAYYMPGALIPARKPVVALLAPQDMKVIFFAPEATVTQLLVGQEVAIRCRHCPPGLSGKISVISQQAEYTPPMLYNNESSKQVVYRIEAAISSQAATHIHFNQPVTVVLE